jgi:hypothetical protein
MSADLKLSGGGEGSQNVKVKSQKSKVKSEEDKSGQGLTYCD